MKRYLLHTPFNIYHFEASEWQHPIHNHTYFEIIFILKGNGVHHLNGNSFDYGHGDVFLLGPDDFHSFEIRALTEFCFIRFNEPFSKILSASDEPGWKPIIESLLHIPLQSRGSLIKEKKDKKKLFNLLSVLESEYENQQSPYYEIVRDSLMRSILIILARKLRQSDNAGQASSYSDSVESILLYVKKNIYSPSRLRIEVLAEEFNVAPNYISIFFKKQIGESIKQYLTNYKFGLIQARLTYSKLTLSKIADEFSFTDESHFCRQFKKYCGVTPSEFRKRN
ncbi:AraC family transcriptional regulator [Algoriphagus sp. NG3]|uniref:AraC family transcriptional regulator n=1 Tax=Algoriphagus sp. NG3 TaxID=3097546 RepID=UPI002A7F7E71|nr:helix-turn-helix domain-containing protein [Algoriphagus sp. NG3]WPR75340.1 helix-turn-helix domain-containing protein [Algoriphagus sp. NG3]